MDRPIIFSAAMIRALLEGRKTMTRRLVTPGTCTVLGSRVTAKSPAWTGLKLDDAEARTKSPASGGPRPHLAVPWVHLEDEARGMKADAIYRVDPIVEVGDRLWVRETWAVGNIYDGVAPRNINPGGKPGWCGVRYAATDQRIGIHDRPSIHMPRWVSRLALTVTDVRLERLNDISEADAAAEGVHPIVDHGVGNQHLHRIAFEQLWDSLHGTGAWAANPWVVAVTFTVHRNGEPQPVRAR